MARETIIALTGLKPGFDAMRVASGKKMEEHQVLDAKTELISTKAIEMVCESIPGTVLQLFALLKQDDLTLDSATKATIASILVSALTTGFSSASISFDFDVDPIKRKEMPDFYGYIPDGGSRTVIFACMLLNSALLLLIRSFSAAMLMQQKKRHFMLYAVGDMALYLLQKVLRGDMTYWAPVDGASGILVTFTTRVVVKIVTDFTGVVHFRHPYEEGGAYWTVNMLLALAVCSGSVVLVGGGAGVWEKKLVGIMCSAWVVVFGVFLLLMKKDYRKTFWSLKTGCEVTCDFFLKGRNDEDRQQIMLCNKKQWRPMRGDVKEWVVDNWWRWRQEKPEWFDEVWMMSVPSDMVPEDEDEVSVRSYRDSSGGESGGSGWRDAQIGPV